MMSNFKDVLNDDLHITIRFNNVVVKLQLY